MYGRVFKLDNPNYNDVYAKNNGTGVPGKVNFLKIDFWSRIKAYVLCSFYESGRFWILDF